MEFAIIDFVKANPILYQRKYQALKFAHPKMEKWRELGKKLRKDPNILRLKWRSLRNHFCRKLKEKGGSNDDDALGHSPRWQYYNHLKFLCSEYENIGPSNKDRSQSPEHTQDITEDIGAMRGEVLECFDLNEYIQKHEISSNPNTMADNENEQYKKWPHLLKSTAISDAFRDMSKLLQKAKQHIVPPSHNQVFFNSLALQVDRAEMMPTDRMRLQQRVMELVTQEILWSREKLE